MSEKTGKNVFTCPGPLCGHHHHRLQPPPPLRFKYSLMGRYGPGTANTRINNAPRWMVVLKAFGHCGTAWAAGLRLIFIRSSTHVHIKLSVLYSIHALRLGLRYSRVRARGFVHSRTRTTYVPTLSAPVACAGQTDRRGTDGPLQEETDTPLSSAIADAAASQVKASCDGADAKSPSTSPSPVPSSPPSSNLVHAATGASALPASGACRLCV